MGMAGSALALNVTGLVPDSPALAARARISAGKGPKQGDGAPCAPGGWRDFCRDPLLLGRMCNTQPHCCPGCAGGAARGCLGGGCACEPAASRWCWLYWGFIGVLLGFWGGKTAWWPVKLPSRALIRATHPARPHITCIIIMCCPSSNRFFVQQGGGPFHVLPHH